MKYTDKQADGLIKNLKISHTPGPWRVLDGAILSDQLNDYGNWIVAQLPERTLQDRANARLIAKAPELLEALQLAFELLEENLPNWYLKAHHNQIRKALEAENEKD